MLHLFLALIVPQQATSAGPARGIHTPLPTPAFEDCNDNGMADHDDIAAGRSADCQGDGVPDECQTAQAFVYSYDDGDLGGSVGTNPRHLAWLSNHTVAPGQEEITEIEIAWGVMPVGTPATLALWSDPDGDGDPTDAQVLMTHTATAVLPNSGIVDLVDVPDTFVGPAGTSFFVGAYGEFEPFPVTYPAALDTDSTTLRSWWVASHTPIDPNDLSAGDVEEYGLIGDECPCNGDWMIRALSCPTGHCDESQDLDDNGIPDECDPDCNGNGTPDDFDVASGTSTDCDGDGVPDECVLPDCDGNGHADLCQALAGGGLSGEYYSNTVLVGVPLPRIDPAVDFDFNADPPFPGAIPDDGFSVRWTGAVVTGAAGTYLFRVDYAHGARLWVNGQLLVNDFDGGSSFASGAVDLAAGTEYYLVLEYVDIGGEAHVQLGWQPPGGVLEPIPSASLRPLHDRGGDFIPDLCQIVDCNGNGVADDEDIALGIVADCDGDSTPDECQHCEDCDRNGLLDACELTAGTGLVGQYWDSEGSAGGFTRLLATRIDPNIDFDWGAGSLLPGGSGDKVTVRWTGTLTTPAVSGTYRFHVESDDGVRFWLDGALLIDEWHPASGNDYEVDVALDANSAHLLELDYFEEAGDARIHLTWTVPGQSEVPVPTTALSPDTDIDGDTIPDVCDMDCDLNGVPDAVDLAAGTHPDSDGNCVPDVCDQGGAYWRFEAAGGATALDSGPNLLDGLLQGGATRTTEVPVAVIPLTGAANTQALDLGYDRGTGGRVSLPTSGLLDARDDSFTLEAWVKLDEVSVAISEDQRQWLFQKKPHASPDTDLDYGFLVQAGDFGVTGRELMLRSADGSRFIEVRSVLSIEDTDWHFVSVAYDALGRRLRFGLDGIYHEVAFSKPDFGPAGPLTLGAHQNAAGVFNQFTRGSIDEARMTRSFLAPEQLLDAQ